MAVDNFTQGEPVKISIALWVSVHQATEAVERYRLEDDMGKGAVAQLAIEGADFWLQEDIAQTPSLLPVNRFE